MDNSRALFTVKDVANIIHTNTAYVYKLISSGLLPAIKLGSYKVRGEALDTFLRSYEGSDLTDPRHIQTISQDSIRE